MYIDRFVHCIHSRMQVDCDENHDLSHEHGVHCYPTFHFYKEGKLVDQFEGADADTLKSKLNSLK